MIFAQAREILGDAEPLPDLDPLARLAMALCHAQLMAEYRDESTAIHEMRGHLAWYTRGAPGARRLRNALNTAGSLQSMLALVEEYAAWYRGLAEEQAGVGSADPSAQKPNGHADA